MAGSTCDLVIIVDETISEYHRGGLEAAGWKIHTIQRIRNPKAEQDAYNEWNYSKFCLWQLSDYDKIIFIDADLLILRNIDFLFEMPEISAIGNNATLFNSGLPPQLWKTLKPFLQPIAYGWMKQSLLNLYLIISVWRFHPQVLRGLFRYQRSWIGSRTGLCM